MFTFGLVHLLRNSKEGVENRTMEFSKMTVICYVISERFLSRPLRSSRRLAKENNWLENQHSIKIFSLYTSLVGRNKRVYKTFWNIFVFIGFVSKWTLERMTQDCTWMNAKMPPNMELRTHFRDNKFWLIKAARVFWVWSVQLCMILFINTSATIKVLKKSWLIYLNITSYSKFPSNQIYSKSAQIPMT